MTESELQAKHFNGSRKLDELIAFESYFEPRKNLYLGYTYDSIKLYETVIKRFFNSSAETIAEVFQYPNGFLVAPKGS